MTGAATGDAAPRDAPRIALLTPTGSDATVTQRVLSQAGFASIVCSDMAAASAEFDGNMAALVVAEEALTKEARAHLTDALARQPAWSDVPVIVLAGQRGPTDSIGPELEQLTTRANVTVLERPVRVATLVTTLRAAERARGRQLELRRHLEERRAAEEELRQSAASLRVAREQADNANRAKTEFLTTMSHELRTPLNAIAGYAQLLALGIRGPLTEEQRQDLERIDKSQRHLLSLINDILNFAKLEAGHVDFDIDRVAIGEVLGSVEPLVTPLLRAKELHYEDNARHCDAMALADEEKVRQIILNLLSNAIKFTPRGGSIHVDCSVDTDNVAVMVTDSGIGIAMEKLNAIFEPFVQLGRRLASSHEGTGLGLSISRNLARAMNGDLSVESQAGQGARFILSLPRAPRSGGSE